MSNHYSSDTMLEVYLFETSQNIEQLETCILESEKSCCFTHSTINEIFRMMHTIKGSSAMMLFNNISRLAHSMEDLFYYLREHNPTHIDFVALSNLILEGIDYIKVELHKIKAGEPANGEVSKLIEEIENHLSQLKHNNPVTEGGKGFEDQKKPRYYIAPSQAHTNEKLYSFKGTIFFDEGCEMENIRAYTIIHNLKDIAKELDYIPNDVIENDDSVYEIRENGFQIYIKTEKTYSELFELLNQTIFLKELELHELNEEYEQDNRSKPNKVEASHIKVPRLSATPGERELPSNALNQSMISVHVAKLDKLMDLVGEMVIAESMVTMNPDLKGLELENFKKAARQLHKITSELQDTVMDIRMVPLSTTFHKMNRIIRDMSKKLGKEVELELIGEATEVDKNIIEHISDPIMHLVRNAIDHGIETTKEREAIGKQRVGRVTLEAKSAGSDVLILIGDDGKGLNKDKIVRKAKENGLLTKAESELTDKEIYNLIFVPGFSTKDKITEFSGRGVGMDVVTKNLEAVGGTISIESIQGKGTTIILKIPLTLAIIEGMNLQVGKAYYTIPITSIRESFRPKASDLIQDPDGNEMIMMRGQCYPIVRLHEFYNVATSVKDFTQGIFIRVEQDQSVFCIFADQLLGQQQVVVKSLPNYIKNTGKRKGLAGCTLLGDGNISLILDIQDLFHNRY